MKRANEDLQQTILIPFPFLAKHRKCSLKRMWDQIEALRTRSKSDCISEDISQLFHSLQSLDFSQPFLKLAAAFTQILSGNLLVLGFKLYSVSTKGTLLLQNGRSHNIWGKVLQQCLYLKQQEFFSQYYREYHGIIKSNYEEFRFRFCSLHDFYGPDKDQQFRGYFGLEKERHNEKETKLRDTKKNEAKRNGTKKNEAKKNEANESLSDSSQITIDILDDKKPVVVLGTHEALQERIRWAYIVKALIGVSRIKFEDEVEVKTSISFGSGDYELEILLGYDHGKQPLAYISANRLFDFHLLDQFHALTFPFQAILIRGPTQ